MTKTDKARELQWQAQDDAMTMARYQEIMSDNARKNRALKEAQKQANELQKRTNIMRKVVKSKKK
jgi:hypothetical protein